jgi:hypothetical protein
MMAVSRRFPEQLSRFSARSAIPESAARILRNSRSIATLKALTEGLKSRGVTRSAAERGVGQTRNSAIERHPKMQKRPSVQEERF